MASIEKTIVFEVIEPRILLSADPLGTGLDSTLPISGDWQTDLYNQPSPETEASKDIQPLSLNDLESFFKQADNKSEPDISLNSFADFLIPTSDITNNIEVIVIDKATPDYQTLLEAIHPSPDTHYQLLFLDDQQSGIEQISDFLSKQSAGSINALHLISHGDSQGLQLGNQWFDNQALTNHSNMIQQWQPAFSQDADILIYGCDLAATVQGQSLIQELATLTATDIAASSDLTGSSDLGGDWDLEFQLGELDTISLSIIDTGTVWSGLLATYTVNTTADTIDVNVGDGLALDASGNTSLRAAIMEANFDAAADDITLPTGTYTLTLGSAFDNAGSQGDLDILQDLTINGTGATNTIINGGGIDRIFDIRNAGTDFVLNNTTLTGGSADGNGSGDGGAIYIDTDSTANLNQVIIDSNLANKGAGIFNLGILDITEAIFNSNGNAGTQLGGAIANYNNASVTQVTFTANQAVDGAALYEHNTAIDLKVENSTLSSNIASGNGGGIYANGTVTILNSTFTLNDANVGGGIFNNTGTVNIKNTIVAGNTASTNNDVSGTFNSLDYNLIQDTTGSLGFAGNDRLGNGADLAPLADNGGFGRTHALLPTSLAIDPAGLTGAPTADQVGNLRDATPDIGAFEFGASNAAPVLDNTVPNQSATEDVFFSFQFAAATFSDPDSDPLLYSATQADGTLLPAWLTFDGVTRTFSGSPTDGDTGNLSIALEAKDGNGGDTTVIFDIAIANVNDAPTLNANPLNPTFIEDAGAVSLYNSAIIDTVEATQLITDINFSVTNILDAGSEYLVIDGTNILLANGVTGKTAINGLGYSVSVVGTNAGIGLNGGLLNRTNAESIINGVSYLNTSNEPDTTPRTVTITGIRDNGGTALGGFDFSSPDLSSIISLVSVNDQPVTSDITINITPDDITTNGMFIVADADLSNSHTFTIASLPTAGNLINNNDGTFSFNLGSDFDDLLPGQSRSISFTYIATDNSGASNDTSRASTITINVGSPALLDITVTDDPVPESSETTELDSPAPPSTVEDSEPATTDNSETEAETENDETLGSDTVSTSNRPQVSDLAFTIAPPETAISVQVNAPVILATPGFEIDNDKTISALTDNVSLASLRIKFELYEDPLIIIQNEQFLRDIDHIQQQLDENTQQRGNTVAGLFAVSAGLSAGYVVWLTRSGILLSSVLSSLPAWRFIDPLPVLINSGNTSTDDDESLQEIIENADKTTEDKASEAQ
ncbi:hypothetical protein R50073_25680 [Maricurvus nonylphenolicus]|uniref:DUF4347 domain-containing protein n=1 Tax=Maricurvus nonylphenolicus TaxID=1008307 RepID=UPI0036F19D53